MKYHCPIQENDKWCSGHASITEQILIKICKMKEKNVYCIKRYVADLVETFISMCESLIIFLVEFFFLIVMSNMSRQKWCFFSDILNITL